MHKKKTHAFTLVELLVVISAVAVLTAILMPTLGAARSESRSLACKSNLRQLLLANIGYATEHDGSYVPAASDMWDSSGGLHRWHGRRETLNDPFDPLKGPLVGYLADGRVKECPAKVEFVKGLAWSANFEQGGGGYGYNKTYIGSRIWQSGTGSIQDWKDSYADTTRMAEVASSGETVMFADAAMSKDHEFLIEYSFVEPPFAVYDGRPMTGFYMSPSMHFRHRGRANVGWVDGHIDPRRIARLDDKNAYGVESAEMQLGWFEPVDNSPYNLK